MKCQKCPKQLRSDNQTGLCRDHYLENYRKTNREMLNEKMRVKRYANVKWQLVHSARARAKRFDLECTITEDDLWVPETCPLIGIEISVHEKTIHSGSPTLDRFDSAKGYTPGNVWVISHLANRMKSSASSAEIDQFAKSWLKMRGIAVFEIEAVYCPACGYAGPHLRTEVDPNGTSVMVRCAHNQCRAEWRVVG